MERCLPLMEKETISNTRFGGGWYTYWKFQAEETHYNGKYFI